MNKPILSVKKLRVKYPIKAGIFFPKEVSRIIAVDDVSFDIFPGETFSIVGESGSGKSTVAKSIVALLENSQGDIVFNGTNVYSCSSSDLMEIRKSIGMVFQDPYGSLNPRMRIGDIIGEPLRAHNLYENFYEYKEKVSKLLKMVGLNPSFYERFPHEFSGGQRQRISIARAISTNPKMLILDEPVSALDVSIQAQIINLLYKLQSELDIAYLFISHDLSVVRHISHKVAVMYLGRIVETSDTEKIFTNPKHPYTQALLSAVPEPDPKIELKRERIILDGELPSSINPPSGCHFHPRCPIAIEECSNIRPLLKSTNTNNHDVACIRV